MTIVGLDQIARQLAVATQPQSVAPTLTRRQGTISAVNAGPPVSVDVTVGGIIIPAVRYLASYAPAAADVVWVDFNGADPLVIGRLATGRQTWAHLRRAAIQAVGNIAVSTIVWDTKVSDTNNFTTVPSDTLTVPSGLGGLYSITARGTFAAAVGTGRAFMTLVTTLDAYRFSFGGTSEDSFAGSVGPVPVAAGEAIQVNVFQSSGGVLNLINARLTVVLLGP